MYLAKRLFTDNCYLLSAILFSTKKHTNNNKLNFPDTNVDLFQVFIDGTRSIYQNLWHPPIYVKANGHAYASVLNIIEDALLKPRHLLDPFLPFSISPHGLTPFGKEFLSSIINNPLNAIQNSIYPMKIISLTDLFMPHNVVIKNCKIFIHVRNCTSKGRSIQFIFLPNLAWYKGK